MTKLLELLRKSVDDGNGGVSSLRIIIVYGVFTLITTFCIICFLACFIELKSQDLIKTLAFQFGVLLTVLLAAKVGQSFSEK